MCFVFMLHKIAWFFLSLLIESLHVMFATKIEFITLSFSSLGIVQLRKPNGGKGREEHVIIL